MASVAVVGQQNVGRVAWESVAEPKVTLMGALRRRFGYRFAQWVMTRQMRAGLAAYHAGPETFAAFMAKARAWHDRYDGPIMPKVEAEAIRTFGPQDAPPAPTASEWFAPKNKRAHGFVFYVHGGSFVAERSPRITQLVAKFAAAANAQVYAPSYRLAPEHPCPAGVDDIARAFRWFRSTWPDEPVVALAESAGAAIMLAALQQVRDEGEEMPNGVVLLSPWIDLSLQSWSVMAASIAGTSPHTMESLAMFAHFYLQGRSPTDPVASPLFGSFDDFPPMLIHASRSDILYDDSVRLADKIRDGGGDLTVRHWADETHVWERMNTPKAQQSIQLAAEFIRRRLDD